MTDEYGQYIDAETGVLVVTHNGMPGPNTLWLLSLKRAALRLRNKWYRRLWRAMIGAK